MQEPPALKEIQRHLSASLRSTRLAAIGRLLHEFPPDHELEALLNDRLKEETDEECLGLLRHAHTMVAQALQTSDRPQERASGIQDDLQFASFPDPERLRFLRSISAKSISAYAERAPIWFSQEKNPIIAAALIKTFGKEWPKEHLQELASNLLTFPGSVRMAVLNTLIEKAPDALIRYLPKLLTTGDPHVHLMAIRGLFKIDPPEALTYLDAFLYNENLDARELAIRDLFHFPFTEIKPVLFSFFSIESDLDLLEKAGTLFEVNPDLESPYRLMEIAENSSAEKAQLIKGIIKNAFQVLQRSGLLKDQFNAYLTQFQTWVKKRNAQRFLQQIFLRLKDLPEEEWQELKPVLLKACKNPDFQSVFPSIFTWALSPAMRRFLEEFMPPVDQPVRLSHETPSQKQLVTADAILAEKPALSESLSAAPPSQAFPTTLPEFLKLTQLEQKRFFSRFVTIDDKLRLQVAKQIVKHPETSRKIKAAALRCCGNLQATEFQVLAGDWLKSSDEELQIGALNYVAQINQEVFSLHLRNCLHTSSVRVRLEAIRLLQTLDPKEALSFAKGMLDTRTPKMHEEGLAAIACFEFSIVRNALFSFLQETIPFSAFESGLSIFRANPDKENLYLLFKLAKELPPDRAELVTSAETHMATDLVSLGILQPEQKTSYKAEFERRLEAELNAKRQPAKAYAFQTLHTSATKPMEPDSRLWGWVALPFLLLLGVFLCFPRSSETPSLPSKLPPAQSVMATPSTSLNVASATVESKPHPDQKLPATPSAPLKVASSTGKIPALPNLSALATATAPLASSTTKPIKPAVQSIPGTSSTPITTPPIQTVTGLVSTRSEDPPGLYFLTTNDEALLVIDGDDRLMNASPGQEFELEIVPTKISPDDVNVVTFIRIISDAKGPAPKSKP